MARRNETKPNKRPVAQYDHKSKKRLNNPPVGLVDAASDAVKVAVLRGRRVVRQGAFSGALEVKA